MEKRHADAADRLLASWEEGAGGITMGVSNYSPKASGTPQTGFIADATLRGVHRQVLARTEIEAIQTRLGARWGCVYSIVIMGIFIDQWAEAVGMRAECARGFLPAAWTRFAISMLARSGDNRSGPSKSQRRGGWKPSSEIKAAVSHLIA